MHSFAGGEMARLIESFDWTRSPLGPMAQWPQSLKTALKICLHSRFQLAIYWGPELVFLYNDAERNVIGAMHPYALGKPACEVLVDMWDTVEPMLSEVLETGEATWSVDRPLMIDRFGLVEEAFFTWSYSPIPDDAGGIGGVLLVTEDTTHRVLAERRLQTLKEMATETAVAMNAEQACAAAVSILGRNPADIPFALLYLVDATGSVTLCASTDSRAARTAKGFPFEEVMRQKEFLLVGNLDRFFDSDLAVQLPKSALIVPIFECGLEKILGFLVAGISDHRRLDTEYRNFFDLIAAQIGTTLAAANDRERERRLRSEADSQRALLETVLNQLPAGVVIARSPSGEVLLANSQAERILQRSVGELRSLEEYSQYPLFRLDGRPYSAQDQPLARSVLRGEVVIGEELKYLRPDGTFRVLLTNSAPVRNEERKIVASVVAFEDITDLRAVQEELLRQSNDVIHELAGKLIVAQEEERRHIARELHDDLSQRMALLQVWLGLFEREAAGLSSKAHEQLHRITGLATEVSTEIHDLSHQLHPPKLDVLGLVNSLAGLCKEFSAQQELQVRFDYHSIPGKIPKDVTLCVFRIVQEALRNVVKHSGATDAKVELTGQGDRIDLCISDSGAGFDTESAKGESGLGLVSMRERLKLVGGRLSVESEPSHGTRIRVHIPLSGVSAGLAGDGNAYGAHR